MNFKLATTRFELTRVELGDATLPEVRLRSRIERYSAIEVGKRRLDPRELEEHLAATNKGARLVGQDLDDSAPDLCSRLELPSSLHRDRLVHELLSVCGKLRPRRRSARHDDRQGSADPLPHSGSNAVQQFQLQGTHPHWWSEETIIAADDGDARLPCYDRSVAISPPVDYIEVTQTTYDSVGYPRYRWVYSNEPTPWARTDKPLSESRVGLVASGGIYVGGQVAFHFKDDTTFRLVPTDVPTADLRPPHFAYDLTDSRRDPNVVFPIDPLRDLVASGEVGELAPQAITFMGGIYSSRRVRDELAPAITDNLRRQEVDVVLLVPV